MEDIFYDRLRQSAEITIGSAPNLYSFVMVNGIRCRLPRTFWSHALDLPEDWTKEDVEKQADAVSELLKTLQSELYLRDVYVLLESKKEPAVLISAFATNRKEA
jgi:hypothetical protein